MTMEYYRGMLVQTQRVEAFRREIHRVVKPGDRVLEIGTGLGTYSFFAAEAGAEMVWAVEGAPVVNVAKTVAQVNQFAGKVRFLRGWFPGVTIPEPIDVLIFEDYPSRLLDSWTYDVLRRLHREVLKPDARVVPCRARLFAAPIQSDRIWKVVGPFAGDHDRAYDIDWMATREYICNSPLHMPVALADMRHEPQLLTDVRLHPLPNATAVGGHASWRFDESAVIHGFAYWFELEVGENTWLSNKPEGEPGSWGYLYLPVDEALAIDAGTTVSLEVGPDVTQTGAPGWLGWNVALDGHVRFRGHEFKSFPASLSDLIPSSPSWVPELTPNARLELQVLSLADGTRTVDEIARVISGTAGAFDIDEARRTVTGVLQGRTEGNPRAQQP